MKQFKQRSFEAKKSEVQSYLDSGSSAGSFAEPPMARGSLVSDGRSLCCFIFTDDFLKTHNLREIVLLQNLIDYLACTQNLECYRKGTSIYFNISPEIFFKTKRLDLLFTVRDYRAFLTMLKDSGLIIDTFSKYYDGHGSRNLYAAFNFWKLNSILETRINWEARCNFFREDDEMLFNINDNRLAAKCNRSAMHVLSDILKVTKVFNTQLNKDKPSKIVLKACRILTDIYNGDFNAENGYVVDENITNTKQFYIPHWEEDLAALKGDWLKIKEFVLSCAKNYEKMFLPEYIPFDSQKKYLTRNIAEWLYCSEVGKSTQSKFIQCFREPCTIVEMNIANSVANIIDEKDNRQLYSFFYDFFPEFFDDAERSYNEIELARNVKQMYQWGNYLKMYDSHSRAIFGNIRYFGTILTNGIAVVYLFCQFLKNKNVKFGDYTFDIETSSQWRYFVEHLVKEYDVNPESAECVTMEDFLRLYRG